MPARKDHMQTKRKIIEIDDERCDGCGRCVIACAEGALQIINGKARVVSDNLCDGIGACIVECPQDALKIIERQAEEYDPEAVEAHLSQLEAESAPEGAACACACPSTQIRAFGTARTGSKPAANQAVENRLSHWPVQIRLVPADAPFLKGADLLVLADCAAVAYPLLHTDLLEGRAVMMGCPKFDDVEGYEAKFAEVISRAGLKGITMVTMEVPCCSGLPKIVKNAMEKAGREVPCREMVISREGEILEDSKGMEQ